jgi:membrane-bound ClpP family serine protease
MLVLILALLLLGLALLVVEAHVPSYGVSGGLGVAAVIAAILLGVTASGGGLALAIAATVPVAAAAAALGTVAVRKAVATRHERAHCGAEGLIGHVGVVRRAPAPLGQVYVDGALWRARHSWGPGEEDALHEGDAVVVERTTGLTLCVRRAEEWELIA